MKVKVIKSFRDKNTGSILRKGLIIDVTEERFSELTGPHGVFVELVREELQLQDETKEETKEEAKTETVQSQEVPQEEKLSKIKKSADSKKTKTSR